MSEFAFEWRGDGSLLSNLKLPLWGVSCSYISAEEIHAVRLWHGEFFGLELHSKMQDVGERDEVGVLQFARFFGESRENFLNSIKFDRPASIEDVFALEVKYPEVGLIDSGVVLYWCEGRIVIVPGALPCSLAVKGVPNFLAKFEPEYPLDEYVEARIRV
jgi:hypothetical protein